MDTVAAGDTAGMNKAPAVECAECARLGMVIRQREAERTELLKEASRDAETIKALRTELRDVQAAYSSKLLEYSAAREEKMDTQKRLTEAQTECEELRNESATKEKTAVGIIAKLEARLETTRGELEELRQRCVNQYGRNKVLEEAAQDKAKDLALAEADNEDLRRQIVGLEDADKPAQRPTPAELAIAELGRIGRGE